MRKDNEEGICRKCKGETSIAFRRERRVLKTEEDSDTPVKTYEKVSIVRCQKDGCYSTVFKPSMIKYKQYAFHEIQSVIEKDFFKLSNTVVFTAACEKTQNNSVHWFLPYWDNVIQSCQEVNKDVSSKAIKRAFIAFIKNNEED